MKVGDLVRKVRPSKRASSAKSVPLKCFGIVVAAAADDGWSGPLFKVDFGDYGVFWHSRDEIELCP